MTESSPADQEYWVSPFEELAQQQDALRDETQGSGMVEPALEGGAPAEEMLASWYGPGFHGSPTASGVPFDPYGFTAAHKTLPFGTELVVNYEGNSVRVTVNDRVPSTEDRELSLSEGAAQALGLTQAGVDYVEVSYPGSGDGYEADPSTPATDTTTNAAANSPNLPEVGIPTPEGGEETGTPYEESVKAQPEVQSDLVDQLDQTPTPSVPPVTYQEPYVPAIEPASGGGAPTEGMLASWYGPGFHGSPTASGVPFDPYGLTAAHPYLPFGTELDVSYGGNSVRVTVNDRGPFTGGRELDLSEGAAQALGLTQAGVDYVGVSYPGSSGYTGGPGAAVDTPYVPPGTYDPNAPIYTGEGVFAPEDVDPYDDLDA